MSNSSGMKPSDGNSPWRCSRKQCEKRLRYRLPTGLSLQKSRKILKETRGRKSAGNRANERKIQTMKNNTSMSGSISLLLGIMVGTVALIFVFCASAVEVTKTSINSQKDRTRIMILLDEAAQYNIQYNASGPDISIYLFEAGLGSIKKKTTTVDNELVESVTLGEPIGGIVEVNISLKGSARFNVFTLESPDRIVIDTMAATAAAGVISAGLVSPTAGEPKMGNIAPLSAIKESGSKTGFSAAKNYMSLQLFFNALLIAALIIISFKLARVMRVSDKNRVELSKNETFANMLGVLRGKIKKRGNDAETTYDSLAQIPYAEQEDKEKASHRVQEQYSKVYELAKLGMDRLEIAKKSNIPIGEVNLILDLSRASSQGKPS
jgi:hypothetical protein